MPRTLTVPRETARTLLGGNWPQDGFSAWNQIDRFYLTSEDTLQGFDGYGDPIGPCFEFTIKVLSK